MVLRRVSTASSRRFRLELDDKGNSVGRGRGDGAGTSSSCSTTLRATRGGTAATAVTRPLDTLGAPRGPLVPEVVLLYKAKDDGEKARAIRGGRAAALRRRASWLRDAVALAHPESPHLAVS